MGCGLRFNPTARFENIFFLFNTEMFFHNRVAALPPEKKFVDAVFIGNGLTGHIAFPQSPGTGHHNHIGKSRFFVDAEHDPRFF